MNFMRICVYGVMIIYVFLRDETCGFCEGKILNSNKDRLVLCYEFVVNYVKKRL